MRGSLIGVGTDIAGSIRIPALCCGAFGFKPSADRVPFGGKASPVKEGCPGIIPCAGPLATSARDVRLFLESVIQASPWDLDYTALAVSWHPVPKKKTMTVGMIMQDPSCPVTPPVARTLRSAVEKLKAAGHHVLVLKAFPSFVEACELAWKYFDLDNEETAYKFISSSGEPWVTSVKKLYTPPPGGRKYRTIEEVYDMNVHRGKFIAQWHDVFMKTGIDVLIAPGAMYTSVPHDEFGYAPYTAMWNLVNVSGAFSLIAGF